MAETNVNDGSNHPERVVEDVLWKLGMERPECREVIAGLISFMRKNLGMMTRQETVVDVLNNSEVAGARMRMARERKGMTQKELAEALGLSVQFISQIETSGRSVPRKHLPAISKILEIQFKDEDQESIEKLANE